MRRLHFEVWDGQRVRKGAIGKIIEAAVEPRHNTLGSCEFTIPATHPRVKDLTVNGGRVTVDYQPDDGSDWMRVFSGRVSNIAGAGRAESATRTFTLTDDWNVLNGVLGWPVPDESILDQDGASYYRVSGPAETVAKDIIGANVDRTGVELTVPATQGRGSNISVQIRMHPLADRLFPAVDQAGIGLRVLQRDANRVLETYEPTTYERVITEESGIIQEGSFNLSRMTTSRVVVAGPGEGVAREFRELISAQRENYIDDVLETFVDARDVEADAGMEAALLTRAQEAMDEGIGKASVSLKLVERGGFRFGKTFGLGDRVSVRMAGMNEPITDLVRGVNFTLNNESGVQVTPLVGDEAEASTGPWLRMVAQMAIALRDLKRR